MACSDKTILYFDLETQLNSDDVGGWSDDNIRDMRVSVGVSYNSQTREFVTYFEAEMPHLVTSILEADMVVGFNVFRFDYVLLSRYRHVPDSNLYDRLCKCPTFDIINKVKNELSHFVSLSNIAKGTLGVDKTGESLDAVELWKAGDDESIKKLTDYCVHDVKLTRDIFVAGCNRGRLHYVSGSNRRPIDTGNWKHLTKQLLNQGGSSK